MYKDVSLGSTIGLKEVMDEEIEAQVICRLYLPRYMSGSRTWRSTCSHNT